MCRSPLLLSGSMAEVRIVEDVVERVLARRSMEVMSSVVSPTRAR